MALNLLFGKLCISLIFDAIVMKYLINQDLLNMGHNKSAITYILANNAQILVATFSKLHKNDINRDWLCFMSNSPSVYNWNYKIRFLIIWYDKKPVKNNIENLINNWYLQLISKQYLLFRILWGLLLLDFKEIFGKSANRSTK